MTEVPSVNRGDELDGVLDTINKLARKSRSGDYIYRGEPKHYDAVSSSLYREYQDIQAEHFEIDVVQKEILSEAKKYTPSTDEFEILTELFNGRLRDECLNEHLFAGLAEARRIIAEWRYDYNTTRPHTSLDGLTPNEFVARPNWGHNLKRFYL